MKATSLTCLAWLAAVNVVFGEAQPELRLAGIINLQNYKSAVLDEWEPRSSRLVIYNLREGQTQQLFEPGKPERRVEVLGVSPIDRSVTVSIDGSKTRLVLAPIGATNSGPKTGVDFSRADLAEVIEIHSYLTSRTALRHPRLPKISVSLQIPGTNRTTIVSTLEKALKEQGVSFIPDGEKFVMVVPNLFATSASPHAPGANIGTNASSRTTSAANQNTFKPGEIELPQIPLEQVLYLYGQLIGATRDSIEEAVAHDFGDRSITLKTATPLTTPEACYALETLFEWNGYKIVPGTNNTLKVISIPAK